jgi:flagellar basal-body rod protein FlgG
MQRALWSAATGMQAQQMRIDTIANNLANVNTSGFKRSRAEFQDLIYQTITTPGAASSNSTSRPAGIQLGLGSKPSSIKRIFGQGDFKTTGNSLDVAISGRGFFKVILPDGSTAYTRDGSFTTNENGEMVNAQGYQLDPPVVLPPDTLSFDIGGDGTVTVRQPGSEPTQVGQIELANFVNPSGLESLGGNLYLPTNASGTALDGTPGLDGLGRLEQGFLEVSNVSIVTELVDMIAAQRAYEMSSKAIKASDEMMQELNSLVR